MTTTSNSASQILSLQEQAAPIKKTEASQSLWTIALRRLSRDRLAKVAIAVLGFFILMAIFAPLISKVTGLKPDVINISDGAVLQPVGSPGHILGTDDQGRDEFIRLVYGGQVSLTIAFSAGVLSLTIGIFLGIVTGFTGGAVDDFMIWFITTLDSIPDLYLLLLLSAIVASAHVSQFSGNKENFLSAMPPTMTVVLVLSIFGWSGTMRLVRGETLSLREREFVVAARSIGASKWRIMFIHILPNIVSVILVTLMITIGNLILVESALSFLGFGVPYNIPTWGNMLSNAEDVYTKALHLALIPGILISITVLCLYVLGDSLRDAFDPKLKEKA